MSNPHFLTAARSVIDILFASVYDDNDDRRCLLLSSNHFATFMQNFDFVAHGSEELAMIAKSKRQIQKFHCFVFDLYDGLHIEEIHHTAKQLALVANQKLRSLGIDIPTVVSPLNKEFEKKVSWRRKTSFASTPFFPHHAA